MISDATTPCIVSVIQAFAIELSLTPSLVYFLQLNVELHQGEETYLTHIKVIDEKRAKQKVLEPV